VHWPILPHHIYDHFSYRYRYLVDLKLVDPFKLLTPSIRDGCQERSTSEPAVRFFHLPL
jgi:hypothetical protein